MATIPDSLSSLFSTTIEERDGTYTIEVPSSEISNNAIRPGGTYRIAVLETVATPAGNALEDSDSPRTRPSLHDAPASPPVTEGELRDVTIETIGDQGDGIAKIGDGYVVIVPDTQPGEQPTVRINTVQRNVAFASVVHHG